MHFNLAFIATDNDIPETVMRQAQYANTATYRANDPTSWGTLLLADTLNTN